MSSIPAGLIAPKPRSAVPFEDAQSHLVAEMALLKLILRHQVLRLRTSGLLVENAFRGLFIADEHVDAILEDSLSRGRPEGCSAASLAQEIADRRNEIASRLEASLEAGVSFPILRLADTLSIDDFHAPLRDNFHLNVIIACVAPELDLDFEALFAYVQNDVNRKAPTADLLLKLFCNSPAERARRRETLSNASPLLKWGIVRATEAPEKSFLSRTFRTDDRVTGFLLDSEGVDARLRPFTHVMHGGMQLRNLLLPETLKIRLKNIAGQLDRQGGIVVLHGPDGAGKRSIAAAVNALGSRPLVNADLSHAAVASLTAAETILLLKREAFLTGANLFLDKADKLPPQELAVVERALEPHGKVIFVASDAPASDFRLRTTDPIISVRIPAPDAEERRMLWEIAAKRTFVPSESTDFSDLAGRFKLTGGQIHAACRSAALNAKLERGEEGLLTTDLLESAAREQAGHGLGRVAPKVESKYAWPDLILPVRPLQQLRTISSSHRFRHQVYARWGFGAKSTAGKGTNVLFFGPSGTGKTMAASVLAAQLALDLYRIDLSSVVSKYIGETEKQLSQIFREASASNAILLFDEADALFGKRSEVRDARDRYANVETAYLLQKMEEYDGIVILTTNFRNNIDEAFARRIHHIVEFPFPDGASRLRIWRQSMPADAPLAADIDFAFLARQLELSGGNIRNAVVAAAFLAAEEATDIHMSHLVIAAAREMQKLGKIPTKADFKQYFELIHAQA